MKEEGVFLVEIYGYYYCCYRNYDLFFVEFEKCLLFGMKLFDFGFVWFFFGDCLVLLLWFFFGMFWFFL